MRRVCRHLLVTLLCTLLAACGTDSSSGAGGATPGVTSGQQTSVTVTQSDSLVPNSSVSLRLTDAPIDNLVAVVVRFDAIEFEAQSGGWIKFTLATPQTIDLLELQGGKTADLLMNVPIVAGNYREIRLITSSDPAHNYVKDKLGGKLPLQIPSGSNFGIKLRQDFIITAAQAASFVIDFDLRQSIRSPGNSGKYRLSPVWRLVAVAGVGGIRGEVDSISLAGPPPACSDNNPKTFNAAYIFSGHNVIPNDINQLGNSNGPFTTASVTYDSGNDEYVYKAAYLPAGKYTVAITCNANLDYLDADDSLKFFDIQNVTVVSNNIVFL